MPSLSTSLKKAYKKVDERDGGVCRHPGCGSSYNTDHHHIERRSQTRDRVDCVENIVTLCQAHHHGSEGPEKSTLWRDYWIRWQKEMYPDKKVIPRLDELEDKWKEWEKCKIAV